MDVNKEIEEIKRNLGDRMMIFGMENQRERNRNEDVLYSYKRTAGIPENGFVQRRKSSNCGGFSENWAVSAFELGVERG
jgi:hypothetical protein